MTKPASVFHYQAATLCGFACLCWLVLACGGDAPEVSDALNYEATAPAALAKASVPEPTIEPSPTTKPAPAPTPTEVPPSPAPTTPATTTASDAEPLAPVATEDANALLADLSEEERSCLSRAVSPDRLATLLRSPDLADEADRSVALDCLERETQLRLLLTPILSATGPLSFESSQCLRNSFADTDLPGLMSAIASQTHPGAPGDPVAVAGMVTFMVALSCLSEAEFRVTAPAIGVAPGAYAGIQCVLEKVGGRDAMTALLTPADELPPALLGAALECREQLATPPPG